VSDGIGERFSRLRGARSITVRELAGATGLPHADLMRLESGARRRPSPELLQRMADYFNTTVEYLRTEAEPAPAALRAGFLREVDRLPTAARYSLKFAPIQGRVEAVLHFLQRSYPTLLDLPQMSARLGYSPASLEDVLRGTAPLQSHLLRLLASHVGLPLDFFIRGDFFGGAALDEHAVDSSRLAEYYQVVQEAIAAGVSPEALRQAVRILAIREGGPALYGANPVP